MCIGHKLVYGIDILEGNNTDLASLYLGRSFGGIMIFIIGIYLVRTFIPFIISLLIAYFVRIAVSRSYTYKGSTFSHLARYYALIWVIVALGQIIYLSIPAGARLA